MRCRSFAFSTLLVMNFAAACNRGDTIRTSPLVGVDESSPARVLANVVTGSLSAPAPGRAVLLAGGETCARAPLGDLTGTAVMKDGGSVGSSVTRADIRWVLAATEGCVDRYRPYGTVTFAFRDNCPNTIDPATVAVASSHGTLTIDRTRTPVTYEIRGATTWDASLTCVGDPPEPVLPVGGPWVLGRGTVEGDVLAGGSRDGDKSSDWWEFRRVLVVSSDDATRRPPAVAVSSPAR